MTSGIRQAFPDDFGRLAEIWESAVKTTHDFLSHEDYEYYKERLPLFFAQVSLWAYHMEDGELAGFAGVSDGNVEMLFVDADFRGQGIGKSLLEFAVDNLGAVSLDVNEQNVRALGFYLRHGFRIVGRSPVDSDGKNYPLLHLMYENK